MASPALSLSWPKASIYTTVGALIVSVTLVELGGGNLERDGVRAPTAFQAHTRALFYVSRTPRSSSVYVDCVGWRPATCRTHHRRENLAFIAATFAELVPPGLLVLLESNALSVSSDDLQRSHFHGRLVFAWPR